MKAPFSGRIAQRFVARGEFLNVGQPLVDLGALDPIEFEFHLAERDTSRIQVGQELRVSLDAHPDELFGAMVTMISPAIDPKTRTLRVLGGQASLVDGQVVSPRDLDGTPVPARVAGAPPTEAVEREP